ncbi:NlpC/P60 family protein [Leeia oryzae]|uniref:NlpC/P60 family protein n=1 Tax=Leeia oryzae TaxID=356662 RepID=UPI00035F2C4E|nr:NlpC/P60 family protein [Leeia oryzae]
MDNSIQKQQNQRIIDVALAHFQPGEFEYGRPDVAYSHKQQQGNKDIYRDERDGPDSDHKKGVDCSALVWRALKEAGFKIDETYPSVTGSNAFSTHSLFNGTHVTPYAQQHFDVLPPAAKHDHNLQPGDLLMLKMPGGSQHIVIFQNYDKHGHIHFFGSQSSTGPASVKLSGNHYWDERTEFLGALRAKPDFIKPEPQLHGTSEHHAHTRSPNVPEALRPLYQQAEAHLSQSLAHLPDHDKHQLIHHVAQITHEQGGKRYDYLFYNADKQLILGQFGEFNDIRLSLSNGAQQHTISASQNQHTVFEHPDQHQKVTPKPTI